MINDTLVDVTGGGTVVNAGGWGWVLVAEAQAACIRDGGGSADEW